MVKGFEFITWELKGYPAVLKEKRDASLSMSDCNCGVAQSEPLVTGESTLGAADWLVDVLESEGRDESSDAVWACWLNDETGSDIRLFRESWGVVTAPGADCVEGSKDEAACGN